MEPADIQASDVENDEPERDAPTEAGDSGENEDLEWRLLPPKEGRAKWWKFYMRYDFEHHPEKADYARCNLCGKDLSVREGSTSAIKSHLERIHPAQFEELKSVAGKGRYRKSFNRAEDPRFDKVENPTLLDPPKGVGEDRGNQHNRCWKYYNRYDLIAHPHKQGVARCKLCENDITYNYGVHNLYRHMANMHADVCKELYGGETFPVPRPQEKLLRRKKMKHAAKDGGEMNVTKAAPDSATGEEKRKDQEEKRKQEKHWLEMWEDTRNKLKKIRRDIKEESDNEMIEDLKEDVEGLKKRKASLAKLLGM